MRNTAPHYLLLCESKSQTIQSGQHGRWSFVLERLGGSQRFEVAEDEPGVQGERLQLFAVVRGLEALEQPSSVTLVTSSAYVGRGIRVNLRVWRENGFRWERFGTMTPIKNRDLWLRIDRAMQFHQVDCRIWNFNIRKEPSSQKAPDLHNQQVSDNISSRWEISPETGSDDESERSAVTNTSEKKNLVHESEAYESDGLGRSYECAAS